MDWNHLPDTIKNASEVTLNSGKCVFSQGQSASNYLFVIHGCIKVFARSSEGREVVLYRVRADEMCILTTACLLGHTNYPAEAVAETDTVALVVPGPEFEHALHESEFLRSFIFEGLSARLAQVMQRFEQLVLESVHHRLIDFLLGHADKGGLVEITHEMLATEIGTAREVVSRHLKVLEKKGLIETRRSMIRVLRPELLNPLD